MSTSVLGESEGTFAWVQHDGVWRIPDKWLEPGKPGEWIGHFDQQPSLHADPNEPPLPLDRHV